MPYQTQSRGVPRIRGTGGPPYDQIGVLLSSSSSSTVAATTAATTVATIKSQIQSKSEATSSSKASGVRVTAKQTNRCAPETWRRAHARRTIRTEDPDLPASLPSLAQEHEFILPRY
ncbi:hypothetical protein TGAM01_v210882 [Trichoderma gamsii]|uniref:Uncharacterized protein n=1 Tax=Trichoderma gamsii TaxID=398673 RepID=A0A2P4Z7J5_9HYPO|nr:hypothetical protein TGAM01_v210882 [Trichoderma gamsii]PON20240.1 hypothetical protein TGAM01_v210882 [Trichoderma gamsii]